MKVSYTGILVGPLALGVAGAFQHRFQDDLLGGEGLGTVKKTFPIAAGPQASVCAAVMGSVVKWGIESFANTTPFLLGATAGAMAVMYGCGLSQNKDYSHQKEGCIAFISITLGSISAAGVAGGVLTHKIVNAFNR